VSAELHDDDWPETVRPGNISAEALKGGRRSWDAGVSQGSAPGYSAGRREGYLAGLIEGFGIGYHEGWSQGFRDGESGGR
jgi:flagellar biosynthesis/type III secretory pathway protein FliH